MSNPHNNRIYHRIEKFSAARYSERHALVTSYDPKTYLAKVTIQPGGQESGWLPIETSHIGNGWGDLIGLTPGSGSSTQSSGTSSSSSSGSSSGSMQGDQVIIRGQEGDIESSKISQRVHSDADIPPVVQAGEMLRKHKLGAKVYHDGKGQLTITDRTNNGQGYTNDFSDAGSAGGGSSGFTPSGSLNRDQIQKPELAQSVSIVLNGKGQLTKAVYDQTNMPSGPGTVQQAQQKYPPLAVTAVADGSKGKGSHKVTTYVQGASGGGSGTSSATQPQPPMPPPACHTSHGCDGTHKVQTFQNTGSQIGGNPPLATEHSSDAKGTITHTTYYPGQGGASSGTSSSGAGASTSGPNFGSAGEGPSISPSFTPPQAVMSTQVQHDGKGNTTITTFKQQGQKAIMSSQVKMDGKGNMVLNTFDDSGGGACTVSMDKNGNMGLNCLKQGNLTISNAGGGVNINSKSMALNVPNITLNGNMSVAGNLSATGGTARAGV